MNGTSNGMSNGSIIRSNSNHGDVANNAVVRATEGWLELFLTPHEKYMFSIWEENIKDKSIVHSVSKPIFEYLATFIPDNVAPNLVTLAGLLCLAQAWYVTNIYGHDYPTTCTWIAILNLIFFFITNSVEPYHTDRIKQKTALGELFRYSCDCLSTVFMTLLMTYCLWGEDEIDEANMGNIKIDKYGNTSNMIQFQWYAVQSTQLILFLKHLSAFRRNAGIRYAVMGPGECILIAVALLAIRGTLGLEKWLDLYEYVLTKFFLNPVQNVTGTISNNINNIAKNSRGGENVVINKISTKIMNVTNSASQSCNNTDNIGELLIQVLYSIIYSVALAQAFALRTKIEPDTKDANKKSTNSDSTTSTTSNGHSNTTQQPTTSQSTTTTTTSNNKTTEDTITGWSRFGIATSLLMRSVPAILMYLGIEQYEVTVIDVICDGFFMAVLTSDIILSKMSFREIHPWIVLMSFATVLSHTVILILCLSYYIAVFADLCFYMNLPLLSTCRNVYCDGVYDLCHIGHKTAFQNALALGGNRLYVGVVGDKDAQNYKRPPIMSHDERCAEVSACKAVTKVIPNAPCFGLTKEFIEKHQIHIVGFGEEYLERYPDPKDDIYYGYVRQIGIAKPLPRTKGLSTSDLIKRIQNAAPADQKKSPT